MMKSQYNGITKDEVFFVEFGLFCCTGDGVKRKTILFFDRDYGGFAGVRAVVSLMANVQLENDGENSWKIVENN